MKIVVTTRTRNESKNISRFCQAYSSIADLILIADGGSDDNTIVKAAQYKNVKVRSFTKRVWREKEWRNPHGEHINFLIEWAKEEKTDWIIFDDCDCVPVLDLQKSARNLIRACTKDVVEVFRLYVYGDDQYFPEMNKPGQSLWAWHKDVSVKALEDNPFEHRMIGWQDACKFTKPYCLLHYFAPDEETIQRKMNFYEKIYGTANHPLQGKKLEKLPNWAKWR